MDDPNDRTYARAPELKDVVELCRRLNDAGARYVLIGGFAVAIHGFTRATKDVDLLVDPCVDNVDAIRRGMSALPDNAVAELGDDDLERYGVVRIADEIVVDLMAAACGLGYSDAVEAGIDRFTMGDVTIPVARKEFLVRTKETVRPHDAVDVQYLRMRIEEEQRGGG